MSKRDLLTGSAAFETFVPSGALSDRGRAIAGMTGDPEPASAAEQPTYPRVSVELVAHNPYNPRAKLPAIQNMADSMEQIENGLITPLAVVTRRAFLAAHPEAEPDLGDTAEYVVIDGNRRLAGARLLGLDDVPYHVDDSLATDREAVLKAALIADAQHEDLDPMDQALALERLLSVHGSQRTVAKMLGKSQGWVSQRLSLLALAEPLQVAVTAGELPIDIARQMAKLPVEQQAAAAAAEIADRATRAASPRESVGVIEQRREQPATGGAATVDPGKKGDYAVITPAPTASDRSAAKTSGPSGGGAPSRHSSGSVRAAEAPAVGVVPVVHIEAPGLVSLVGAASVEQIADALIEARSAKDLYALMHTIADRLRDRGQHED